MRPIRNKKGFSLLELSMVMIVMGLTATGLMSVVLKTTESQRIATTQERMAIVNKRIAGFLREQGRIPCPANGTLALTNAAFGFEQIDNASQASVDTCTSGHGISAHIRMGAIPTRTLDLPDYLQLDGWGRRMNYVVDDNFISSTTTFTGCDGTTAAKSTCFEFMPAGSIIVQTGNGTDTHTTTAVYALISAGINGHGAFPDNGGAVIDNSTDVSEEENAHVHNTFNDTFVMKEQSSTFDDIVSYREKPQVITEIQPAMTESVCSMAKNVVENLHPDANEVCTGPARIDGGALENCEGFAQEIHKVCAGLYE